jgi:cytochrome c553
VRAIAIEALAWVAALLLLPGSSRGADPKAGEQKAQVCAACHGPGGNSAIPANPSISQQPELFLSTALIMFRDGIRQDPQMSPMAEKLSNDDVNDLAAYFSRQKAAPPQHKTSPANASAGPGLAQKFNCTQCHGAKLLGQQQIPRLAAQHFEYLQKELRLFKASKRADMDGVMTSAAQGLTDRDIEALSDYMAGLEPR